MGRIWKRSPCEPPALSSEERDTREDGTNLPQNHFASCGLSLDEYKEILELISDQTSIRTRSYHRIAVTLSVTVILLSIWGVPIEEIRFLGVTGANTHIPDVTTSIAALVALTGALYGISWWIDLGVAGAKTEYANQKLSRSAYHLSYIEKNIACGKHLYKDAFSNVSHNPEANHVKSQIDRMSDDAQRALTAVKFLNRRNSIHRVWRWADLIATLAVTVYAIVILVSITL